MKEIFRRARRKSRRQKAQEHQDPDLLFDGDDELFKEVVLGASRYAEYGCGKSTVWVAKNTSAEIRAVDTSAEWIANVEREISGRSAQFTHIDCGEIGNWGRPKTYAKRTSFGAYARSFFDEGFEPDVVLIDGRFRVCCFLTALARSPSGTVLLFDDYARRPHYHLVEEFVPVKAKCGRQFLFEAPSLNETARAEILRTAEKFEYVID